MNKEIANTRTLMVGLLVILLAVLVIKPATLNEENIAGDARYKAINNKISQNYVSTQKYNADMAQLNKKITELEAQIAAGGTGDNSALLNRIETLEAQIAYTANDDGDMGHDGDTDGDGFTISEGDCNDKNPEVHPDAIESCMEPGDENCNGEVDEGCTSVCDDFDECTEEVFDQESLECVYTQVC